MEINSVTDLVAVVKSAYEASDIKTKDGKDLKKRDIILVDRCLKETRLTLWGEKVFIFCSFFIYIVYYLYFYSYFLFINIQYNV